MFLGSCGFALGSASFTALALGQSQSNWQYNPIRKFEQATIDPIFTAGQLQLIPRALNVFYQRFLKDAVTIRAWNLSYLDDYLSDHEHQNSPPRVVLPLTMIEPSYLQRAKKHPDLKWRPYLGSDECYFINDQIRNMAILCGHAPFPSIDIYAYYANPRGSSEEDRRYGNSVARAQVGTMMVTKKEFAGHFRIGINRYYLASRRNKLYLNPVYWAGVIAHELSHNLGHTHPDASHPDYHRYQINLWGYAVQTDGKHVYGRQAPAKCTV